MVVANAIADRGAPTSTSFMLRNQRAVWKASYLVSCYSGLNISAGRSRGCCVVSSICRPSLCAARTCWGSASGPGP
eukprot:8411003-Pyramimonas_sp.AAC.1